MSDLPDRFPRGWFVLGHQRDFIRGEIKTPNDEQTKGVVSRKRDYLV